jgi:TolA-binding protein
MVHLQLVMHGLFIAFFAWLLLHALLVHSKSSSSRGPLIEGLDATATATTTATTTTSPQAQADENTAEIAVLKGQIATLLQTAQTLKTQMLQNETSIQNNTKSIQQVVQSQTDTTNKLAASKGKQ